MCGIAGLYNIDGEPADQALLARMADCIAHRGPDAEGFFTDGGLGFAHRHLRIIDLSDAALQPMRNEDGTIYLIFNGEVYNYIELRPAIEAKGHRFRSHSDSETIIHAYEEWGVQGCLQRLNGMFAFALWDAPRKRLTVARDRLGVKPLYYRWDGRTLIFASEIKALLRHPGTPLEPNLEAVAQYMSAMYTVGEHTWFGGIKKLLPGHYLTVSPDGLSVRRWWDIPAHEHEPGERPERYYVNKTRHLLDDSVRLRLRSDVPLGAHLSGGIDSSAVVGLLSHHLKAEGERVRTFSGAFSEGPEYDERRYIRLVVNRYGTHHSLALPSAQDLPELMDRMVWHMDEPAAGPGILLQWHVCRITRESGVTVINGGQGGDEAWGGYFGYIPAYINTLMLQAPRHPALAGRLLADALRIVSRSHTRGALRRAYAAGRTGRLAAYNDLGAWAGHRFGDSKLTFNGRAELQDAPGMADRTPLGRATYQDLKWYLPALLQVEDRTSMAFSLESRAPLLDYRLIEHAAAVPSALKIKRLTMKHVLREAVRDLLPPAIYERKDKMGMPTPVDRWFRGELAPWVQETLLGRPASGLIAPEYAREAVREHRAGAKDRSVDLWKLLNVETWWRVFFEERQSGMVEDRRVSAVGVGR